MSFANPNALWLLLVFPPALLVFFWWSWRKRQALMTRFIQARLLPGLLSGISPAREKVRCAGLVLAVVCLIAALARPQWGFTWEEVKQRGLDIVVAIDTSKSMLAEDIPPNRLARAKLAALELMQRAKSDRLGLVAFAGSAFLQCPLTIDDAVFRQSVEALDVQTISEGGTAIAEAIEIAQTAFKEGDNHKVLVLFTDGEDHDSGALEVARKAAETGLQIFTIGIGSAEGELLRVKDANGGNDYIRDEQGNVVKSHLNETLLQQLAGTTERGFYLPLRGAKAIDTLYEKGLASLPKSEGQEKLAKHLHERYHWPLTAGILLLIAEMLFPERKREPKARPAPTAAPPAKPLVRRAVVAVLLLLSLPLVGFGSPSSALRDYQAEKYDQALKEYEQLLKRKGDDPRLHFNAGASAYREHKFEEADKQFDAALTSPDLKLQSRAYYNRGNTRFYLGANASDPKQRTETWKKALQDYQSSMKLNAQDTDAKHNYDFVKKVLEELQQQPPQNQQNKSDQDQNQDQQKQKQQQQQQKPDQKKQEEQKDQNQQQQQAQQKQAEQKQDPNQQNQQAEQQKQEEQKRQQAQDQQQQKQQEAKQASPEPKDKSDEKDQKEEKAYAEGEMTPQQAQQLLDAQKADEQVLPPEKPDKKPVDHSKPIRDW